jgi:hypothetical protein
VAPERSEAKGRARATQAEGRGADEGAAVRRRGACAEVGASRMTGQPGPPQAWYRCTRGAAVVKRRERGHGDSARRNNARKGEKKSNGGRRDASEPSSGREKKGSRDTGADGDISTRS